MTTTETTFKPILFSTEMVQAILEGRKGQTRRKFKDEVFPNESELIYVTDTNDGRKLYHFGIKGKQPCPHQGVIGEYTKGDVLWVRETWKPGAWNDEDYKVAFDYKASPEIKKTPWSHYADIDRFEQHHTKWIEMLCKMGIEPRKIDTQEERVYWKWLPGQSPFKWQPSIFMPKEACRIFLEVTDVRIERLKNITKLDARNEGISWWVESGRPRFKNYLNDGNGDSFGKAIASFASLWESINGSDSWDKNPWVWVTDFKRIEKPQNFI